MIKYIIAAIAAFSISSCTDASRAKATGFGATYKVELFSGGKMVRSWVSSGKVLSEKDSDGYYFNDKETGKLVEVNGDIVITQQ